MPGLLAQLFQTGELEPLGDAAHARLRARAEAREGDWAMVLAGASALIAAAFWAGGGFALAWVVGAMNAPGAGAGGAPMMPALGFARFSVINIAFALGAGATTYLVVREWRLAKAMRRILNRAGCPYCEFSLVGLSPAQGAVTCPECGHMVVLAEHHIPPDALVLPHTIPVPDAGPLGSFSGQVPQGKKRRIVRPFGGISRRSSGASKPTGGPGGGELL